MRSAAGRRVVVVLMCAVMALGAYLAARPLVADLLWSHASASAREEVAAEAEELGDDAVEGLLEEALAYNAALAEQALGAHTLSEGEKSRYLSQLGGAGTSQVMGAVEIPALGLTERICYGTSETALMAGLGHCEWSSLPVGGTSTHCVLAGHSGMEDHRMLDGASDLKQGDHVYVTVLGKTLSYEVASLETVLPDKTASLAIEDGRDLLTLVTCVPYGVNSHRLLVHCKRCNHEPVRAREAGLSSLVVGATGRSVSWIRVIPVVLVLAIVIALFVHLLRPGRNTERSQQHERKAYGHRRSSRRGLRLGRRRRRRRRRRRGARA